MARVENQDFMNSAADSQARSITLTKPTLVRWKPSFVTERNRISVQLIPTPPQVRGFVLYYMYELFSVIAVQLTGTSFKIFYFRSYNQQVQQRLADELSFEVQSKRLYLILLRRLQQASRAGCRLDDYIKSSLDTAEMFMRAWSQLATLLCAPITTMRSQWCSGRPSCPLFLFIPLWALVSQRKWSIPL